MAVVALGAVAACTSHDGGSSQVHDGGTPPILEDSAPVHDGTTPPIDDGTTPPVEGSVAAPTGQPGGSDIVVHTDVSSGDFQDGLLGTNVPAWLGPDLLADPNFHDAVLALGTTSLRLPGGSWSNHYDWLACELGDPDGCYWPWAARPTDFLSLLASTELPGMWTVSINGTAQEAAALVAFFNGAVDDDRLIGEDRRGRDWMTVGHWAQLREANGHPDPHPIMTWEIGNEVYGAIASTGPGCAPFGWENVWTCSGTEYATGTSGHDGYIEFARAMRAVDPDVRLGAVGVAEQSSWSNWGNEVIGAAGEQIDFYVVHHYGFDSTVDPGRTVDIPSRTWPEIALDVQDAFASHGHEESTIAVTEHNLVAFLDADTTAAMGTFLNALYLTETIGQMALSGIEVANHWNLANGRHENGSDYGMIDVESGALAPTYHALELWSRFGEELLVIDVGSDLADLRTYASRSSDGTFQILVINPAAQPVEATVRLIPDGGPQRVTADVLTASSTSSTVILRNGDDGSNIDSLASPPSQLDAPGGKLRHEFPGTSITLLDFHAPVEP